MTMHVIEMSAADISAQSGRVPESDGGQNIALIL